MRDTLNHWVQECSHCRYSAPDISQKIPGEVHSIVRSEAYQAIECKFQRLSWMLAQLGEFADAGWSALHAAWNADDSEDDATARACRGLAIELWKKGKRDGQKFMPSREQEFALVTDLLRRRGEFVEARLTCIEGLNEPNLTPRIEDILRFELTLIGFGDTASHSLRELPKPPDGGERVRIV